MRIIQAFFFFMLLWSTHLHATQTFTSDTIDVRNSGPIASLFSLPRADFFSSQEPGIVTLQSELELTNYFSTSKKGGDLLRIDGESWRARNKLSYQLNEQLQVHISSAWIKHSGGISDRLIYQFHDALQLPQNGRTKNQNDILSWQLSAGSEQQALLSEDVSSWGDVELSLAWKPKSVDATQVNTTLKLPTGNFREQSGSEKADFNVSVSQQNPKWFKRRKFLQQIPLSLWYGAGLGYIGEADKVKGLSQYPINLSLRGGFAWRVSGNWQLKAQLDSYSPLFDTDLRELGWIPFQASFESKHRLSLDTLIKFMIAEDLRPRTVPDVIFSTGLIIKL